MPGGGGGGETQETEPWEEQQPYLKKGFRAAEQDVLNRPTEFYGGQTYADFTPEQLQAQELTAARALNNPLLGIGQGQVAQTAAGAYGFGSPYMQNIQDQMVASAREQVDPMFAQAHSRVGSPGHAEALGRGVARGMTPYMEAERGRQLQAAGMAPQMAMADYADIQALGGVGMQKQALDQAAINEQMARFQYEQDEPTRRIQDYMGLVGGGNYGGVTRVDTGGGNPIMGTAGGALSGAMMGAPLGPVGMGVGAVGGGLMGYFGSQ